MVARSGARVSFHYSFRRTRRPGTRRRVSPCSRASPHCPHIDHDTQAPLRLRTLNSKSGPRARPQEHKTQKYKKIDLDLKLSPIYWRFRIYFNLYRCASRVCSSVSALCQV